jgi:dCTP deaminase
MILSDKAIRDRLGRSIDDEERIVIDPYPSDECFQPVTVDLKLNNEFIVYRGSNYNTLIPKGDNKTQKIIKEEYWIEPGQFLLASTVEQVYIPKDLAARVEGKSSLGRLGLAVHVTAGFIDPNFYGNITLELKNMNKCMIKLTSGMKICQLRFIKVSGEVLRPYGSKELNSHYQDSKGTII